MGNPKKTPNPVEDFCCGSYSSEAGCSHEPGCYPKQKELLPNAINIHRKFEYADWTARWQVHGRSSPPRYKRVTVPDWIKEGRNRDTNTNLD